MFIPPLTWIDYALGWSAVLVIILCGLFSPRFKLVPLRMVTVALLATLIACGFIETLLHFEFFFEPEKGIWTPTHYIRLSEARYKNHRAIASKNRFGFNDRDLGEDKSPGTLRCAVIGDSFVFGDGLERDEIWSVKLIKALSEKLPNFEGLNWGKSGWSTRDELQFLKQNGAPFQLDCLIVGWVANDVDPGEIGHTILTWQYDRMFWPVWAVLPETFSYFAAHINHLLTRNNPKLGYNHWLQQLYSEKNVTSYRSVLLELKAWCAEHNIELFVIMTPSNYSEQLERYFVQMDSLFNELGFQHLNLFPELKDKFAHRPISELVANPADHHPGPLVTTEISNSTFEFLIRNTKFESIFFKEAQTLE